MIQESEVHYIGSAQFETKSLDCEETKGGNSTFSYSVVYFTLFTLEDFKVK